MSMKMRALTDLSLRKSPDRTITRDGVEVPNPKWDEWYQWTEGKVFTAPSHLKWKRGVERGIMEVVNDG